VTDRDLEDVFNEARQKEARMVTLELCYKQLREDTDWVKKEIGNAKNFLIATMAGVVLNLFLFILTLVIKKL
jgi:hypothetical protein